ncbi:MAG: TIGR04063 family PEP-CTERM/XrtA system glycosyltransferase [Pseudomonadota bacterium]
MRILHVFDHSVPHQSGYAVRSLAIMAAQERRGWTVAALTSPRHGPSAEEEETVEGRSFSRASAQATSIPVLRELVEMRATRARLKDVAARFRPDIIHAHSPVLTAFPARAVARALRLPMTYEIRAFWEDAAVDHGTTREGSPRYRLTRQLETRAARGADHVFTICEGLRADLARRSIAPGKISLIPNAVDLARLTPVDRRAPDVVALRERLGLAEDEAVISFIGSFYAYEGLDLAIEAIGRLNESGRNVRLMIVGAGPEEADLKARAEALGERVLFPGRAPMSDVPYYYALTDLLVLPRKSMRLTELVTPLKPLEAMALGAPVLASDVGGHKELVRDGETGFLFPAGDVEALARRIGEILDARDGLDALKARARAFVERERTWDAAIKGYAEPFERLARAQSASRQ